MRYLLVKSADPEEAAAAAYHGALRFGSDVPLVFYAPPGTVEVLTDDAGGILLEDEGEASRLEREIESLLSAVAVKSARLSTLKGGK